MNVNPYLSFDGHCEAAFRFYAQCFGASIGMLFKFREAPPGTPTPPGWEDKVMHASLPIGSTTLMGADAPPPMHERAQGITVSFSADSPKDAERIFAALMDKGQIRMPIQETFWAPRFGMGVDRFGIPWMVSCEPAS